MSIFIFTLKRLILSELFDVEHSLEFKVTRMRISMNIDEFYRLMARIQIQEEEKLLVLKYVNGLSFYIQKDMEFLNVSMLSDALLNNTKAKDKGKSLFTTKPTG